MIANLLFLGVGLAVVANLASLAFKLWRVRVDAGAAWSHRRESGPDAEIDGLDEAAFRRAFYRAHGPRGAAHAAAGVVLALVLTPAAVLLLGHVWRFFWRLAGEPEMYREGYLIWQFYLFFGLIGSWVLIAALVAQHYHRNRPRELKFELARAREAARGSPMRPVDPRRTT